MANATVRVIDKVKTIGKPVVPFDANATQTSAGGAAVSVTVTADANRPIGLYQAIWSFSAAPQAGTTLKIEDGSGTTVWGPHYVPAAAGVYSIVFDPPLCGTKNTALIGTLSAPGGAIVGVLTLTPCVVGQDLC